jgi:hypothetical protein
MTKGRGGVHGSGRAATRAAPPMSAMFLVKLTISCVRSICSLMRQTRESVGIRTPEEPCQIAVVAPRPE